MPTHSFWKRHIRPTYKRAWLTLTRQLPVINPDACAPSANGRLYVDPSASRSHDYDYPGRQGLQLPVRLGSCLCTQEQLASPAFRYWNGRMNNRFHMHRKLWEQAYIAQALYERNMLRPGARGLAFAVGQEPIPRLFAEFGCEILATDLDANDERALRWRTSGQHMDSIKRLTQSPAGTISYRHVDMNHIPDDLVDFDFTWSTCSFEHCGSIRLGQEFIWNQMQCLKPGGVAVHTTEFNLTSDVRTIETGRTVLYRRRDIEGIIEPLLAAGHHVEPISLDAGSSTLDRHVDWPPYSSEKHLRLVLKKYAATSIGLIIRKSAAAVQARSA